MRKLLILGGAILCLSLTATAQDSTAALDASSPASEPAAPASLYPSDRSPWQLSMGYQYQHYSIQGLRFHDNGLNTDVTRYLNNWIGLEGLVAMGFGHLSNIPVNLCNCAKSFFLGGGLHVAANNHSRFEPWIHALVGWQHFRFAQTATMDGSQSALGLMAGGGVDVKLGGRVSWRLQGDYIGTHFNSAMQTNYSVGSGLVLNF